MTPAYSAGILAWVEAGGVYAIAGLRGGSEEGEEWHRAGMLDRKQNVFDDFHAAAEHLIATGVTTRGQLAVWGGSNGGLLVGAAVTQRPTLFAAAVCSAPLLDMVRYERFGLGETWNTEYGSAAVPRELEWLLVLAVPPGRRGRRVSGGAVHRVHQRHTGRPDARLQNVRGAAARVRRRGQAACSCGPRARSATGARGVAVGGAVGRGLAFVARETGCYFPPGSPRPRAAVSPCA